MPAAHQPSPPSSPSKREREPASSPSAKSPAAKAQAVVDDEAVDDEEVQEVD